jgi:hypothetical protein
MHNSAEIGWIGAIIIGGLAGWFAEIVAVLMLRLPASATGESL